MVGPLFQPSRHEPLRELDWDADVARDGARRLAQAVLADRRPEGNWDLHPLDEDSGGLVRPHEGLYLGSAGVLVGLARLARAGVIEELADLDEELAAAHERYRVAPDAGDDIPSWLVGETGILAARLTVRRDEEALTALATRVAENAESHERELLYGAPGTTLAASIVLARTGEHDGLRRAAVASTNGLLACAVERRNGAHWVQRLAGEAVAHLGAGHGLAGILCALGVAARAGLVVDEPRWSTLAALGRRTLLETAWAEPNAANWPVRLDGDHALVQWCHGAPGIISSLCTAFPEPCEEIFEHLLVDAGELVWRAGPLRKGPTLCHGTAGNGWALLKLYERSGNVGWLERARLFAMHALAQADDAITRYGRARPSLFTGDVGVALYLMDCIDARADVPAIDSL
jgi:hypothetical protein